MFNVSFSDFFPFLHGAAVFILFVFAGHHYEAAGRRRYEYLTARDGTACQRYHRMRWLRGRLAGNVGMIGCLVGCVLIFVFPWADVVLALGLVPLVHTIGNYRGERWSDFPALMLLWARNAKIDFRASPG